MRKTKPTLSAHSQRTKIVVTIGPASRDKETICRMVANGMNVARLNFSHGDFAEHSLSLSLVKAVAKETGRPIAILQDLAGPKIRIGDFNNADNAIELKPGSVFTLTTKKCLGDKHSAWVSYKSLPQYVRKGSVIMLNDGRQRLRVVAASDTEIRTKVEVGGRIRGRRGVNVPGAELAMSSLTKKDKTDITFAKQYPVDYLGLSFVRRASDITELRTILKKSGLEHIQIIAKLETEEAVNNLAEIVEAADGIMVARGDLAVEIPTENVPVVQKRAIRLCNEAGKPVITATQMLNSMVSSANPTRAEVSDVANAIFDGTDAVMLSDESAVGAYPVEAVATMAQVARGVESTSYAAQPVARITESIRGAARTVEDVMSLAAADVANQVGATVIVALTESGMTARLVARFKPKQPIIALTPNEQTYWHLSLSGNCHPILTKSFTDFGEIQKRISTVLKENKLAKAGDQVVVCAGVPFGIAGGTNLATVLEVA